MSAATTEKHESPIVENVSELEFLATMQVVCGGEGYIDFKAGKNIRNLFPTIIFCVRFLIVDLRGETISR